MVFSVLSLGAALPLVNSQMTAATQAHADETQDKLEEAKKKAKINNDKDFEKLTQQIDKGEIDPDANREHFSYIVKRLLYVGYLNYTPLGTPGGDNPKKPADGYNCHVDDGWRGTAMYHNCDVPNFITEFFQGIVQLVSPMGFDVAEVTSAKSDDYFGVPTASIPGGLVPLDYAKKNTKYTALETLGYSMHYTSYRGEWDNINVMNSARALANFGLMDNIHLGFDAAINGVKGAAKGAADGAKEGYDQAGIVGGVVGAYLGFFKGGATNIINTILDTSDLNVFNSFAWYRSNYGSTLYNARELDQTELSMLMTKFYADYVSDTSKSKDIKAPAEYENIKNGPPKPTDAIPKCLIDGKEVGSKDNPLTQEQCETQAGSQNTKAQWTKDGNGKGQTLAQWYEANKTVITDAKSKGIDCPIDVKVEGSAADRQAKLDSFYSCWSEKWEASKNKVIQDAIVKEQAAKDSKDSAGEKVLKSFANTFAGFLQKKPENNFNAPWSRFVCTDAEGKDLDGFPYRFVYDKNGNKTPGCEEIRPPIQNGYFGNGYLGISENPKPLPDTRRQVFQDISPLTLIFDLQNWSTVGANFLLSGSAFFTKVANGALDLSFSPILAKLGLNTKIADLMESFRESVYFALIVLMMAFSALTALIKGATRGDYRGVLMNVGYSIFVFFIGVMVMAQPMRSIKFVDETPAMVERAIAGTIFSVTENTDNQLCTASGTVGDVDKNSTDLNGEALSTSPQAAVRTMECEVWRSFLFNPYVQGQWGTGYDNLATNKFTNTNGNLVGDASVPMGGGVTEKNWALYQARVLAAGTATTVDPAKSSTVKPRNLYRMVDLQAGPRLAEGRDTRYFESWTGQNYLARFMITFGGFLLAGLGALVVVVYAVEKIKVTFLSIFLLMFLPLVMLMAPHPTFGKVNLRKYLGTLGGLMIHRVVLVMLLSVMLKIVTAINAAAPATLMGTIITMGVLLYFLEARNTFFDFVNSSVSRASGGQFLTGKENFDTVKSKLPASLRNEMTMRRATMRGAAQGAIGGFMVDGMDGARKGYGRGIEANRRRAQRANLRHGLGVAQVMQGASSAGKQAAESEKRALRSYLMDHKQDKHDLQRNTNSVLAQRHFKEKNERLTRLRQQGHDDNSYAVKSLELEEAIKVDLYNDHDLKDMGQLKEINDRIDALEAKLAQGSKSRKMNHAYVKKVFNRNDPVATRKLLDKQSKIATGRNKPILEDMKAAYDEIETVQERMYLRHEDERYRAPVTTKQRRKKYLQDVETELDKFLAERQAETDKLLKDNAQLSSSNSLTKEAKASVLRESDRYKDGV